MSETTLAERFERNVQPEPNSGCWLWTGAKVPDGYGQLRHGRGLMQAHRLAWMLANGPIPKGACVLHRCDCPPCVNPAHLFLGTRLDNMRDAVSKGRNASGERIWTAKLTGKTVTEIRALATTGVSKVELSKQFGVSYETIRRIVTQQRWRRVAEYV